MFCFVFYEGCEFLDCARGYMAFYGQAYVRDCHFERSSEADITAEIGPTTTVNRCTSIGSHRFFWTSADSNPYGGCTPISDCRVSGWKANDGAIRILGTHLIRDCDFSNPPDGNPPIYVLDGVSEDQSIVIGGNTCDGPLIAKSTKLRIDEIPNGKRPRTGITANTHFLKQTLPSFSGAIYDAKTQFKAEGNGSTDDTAAVQNCINAARDNGGIAYFPAGDYKLTSPVTISGGGYRIEGSGAFSRFRWAGGAQPYMFRMENPQDIKIRCINVAPHPELTDAAVLHTSTDRSSNATYEMLWIWDESDQGLRGLTFDNMAASSKAHVINVMGAVKVRNSSRAQILCNYAGSTSQRPFKVEGTSKRDGFLGVLTLEGAIEVRDNQNLVVENCYFEAYDKFIQMWGSGSTPGYVTIGGDAPYWTPWSYNRTDDAARRDTIVIDNYNGRLYRGGAYTEQLNPAGASTVRHTGSNPLDIMFVTNQIGVRGTMNADWDWQLGEGARKISVGNTTLRENSGFFWKSWNIDNAIPPKGLNSIAAAWDDLRLLGQVDLAWNYPTINQSRRK